MFKKSVRPFLAAFCFLILVTQFQNCSVNEGFQSNSSITPLESNAFLQDPDDDHDPDPDLKEKVTTKYEPILADRYYLQSLLTDIFGPAALAADSTKAFYGALDHGSPCSVYEDHNTYNAVTKRWVQADRMELCTRASSLHLVAQVNPKPTITRQAQLTHACSDLTTNNTTLNFALAKIQAGVPAATDENVLKLFRMFYRQRPDPHQGLIDSILVMLPADGLTKDHWRVAVYTVCASSHWQVL